MQAWTIYWTSFNIPAPFISVSIQSMWEWAKVPTVQPHWSLEKATKSQLQSVVFITNRQIYNAYEPRHVSFQYYIFPCSEWKSEGLHISISVSFLLKVFPRLPMPLSLFTTSVAVAVLFIPDGSIIELNGNRPVRKKERSIGTKWQFYRM